MRGKSAFESLRINQNDPIGLRALLLSRGLMGDRLGPCQFQLDNLVNMTNEQLRATRSTDSVLVTTEKPKGTGTESGSPLFSSQTTKVLVYTVMTFQVMCQMSQEQQLSSSNASRQRPCAELDYSNRNQTPTPKLFQILSLICQVTIFAQAVIFMLFLAKQIKFKSNCHESQPLHPEMHLALSHSHSADANSPNQSDSLTRETTATSSTLSNQGAPVSSGMTALFLPSFLLLQNVLRMRFTTQVSEEEAPQYVATMVENQALVILATYLLASRSKSALVFYCIHSLIKMAELLLINDPALLKHFLGLQALSLVTNLFAVWYFQIKRPKTQSQGQVKSDLKLDDRQKPAQVLPTSPKSEARRAEEPNCLSSLDLPQTKKEGSGEPQQAKKYDILLANTFNQNPNAMLIVSPEDPSNVIFANLKAFETFVEDEPQLSEQAIQPSGAPYSAFKDAQTAHQDDFKEAIRHELSQDKLEALRARLSVASIFDVQSIQLPPTTLDSIRLQSRVSEPSNDSDGDGGDDLKTLAEVCDQFMSRNDSEAQQNFYVSLVNKKAQLSSPRNDDELEQIECENETNPYEYTLLKLTLIKVNQTVLKRRKPKTQSFLQSPPLNAYDHELTSARPPAHSQQYLVLQFSNEDDRVASGGAFAEMKTKFEARLKKERKGFIESLKQTFNHEVVTPLKNCIMLVSVAVAYMQGEGNAAASATASHLSMVNYQLSLLLNYQQNIELLGNLQDDNLQADIREFSPKNVIEYVVTMFECQVKMQRSQIHMVHDCDLPEEARYFEHSLQAFIERIDDPAFDAQHFMALRSGVKEERKIRGQNGEFVCLESSAAIPLASSNSSAAASVTTSQETVVKGDGQMFETILTNVLKNAAQNTVGGDMYVLHYLDIEKGQLRVTIIDTGVGMTEEAIAKCKSQLGYQKRSAEVNSNGIGLGLAVSSGLLSLLNGDLDVHSFGQGKGTVVSFSFQVEVETVRVPKRQSFSLQDDTQLNELDSVQSSQSTESASYGSEAVLSGNELRGAANPVAGTQQSQLRLTKIKSGSSESSLNNSQKSKSSKSRSRNRYRKSPRQVSCSASHNSQALRDEVNQERDQRWIGQLKRPLRMCIQTDNSIQGLVPLQRQPQNPKNVSHTDRGFKILERCASPPQRNALGQLAMASHDQEVSDSNQLYEVSYSGNLAEASCKSGSVKNRSSDHRPNHVISIANSILVKSLLESGSNINESQAQPSSPLGVNEPQVGEPFGFLRHNFLSMLRLESYDGENENLSPTQTKQLELSSPILHIDRSQDGSLDKKSKQPGALLPQPMLYPLSRSEKNPSETYDNCPVSNDQDLQSDQAIGCEGLQDINSDLIIIEEGRQSTESKEANILQRFGINDLDGELYQNNQLSEIWPSLNRAQFDSQQNSDPERHIMEEEDKEDEWLEDESAPDKQLDWLMEDSQPECSDAQIILLNSPEITPQQEDPLSPSQADAEEDGYDAMGIDLRSQSKQNKWSSRRSKSFNDDSLIIASHSRKRREQKSCKQQPKRISCKSRHNNWKDGLYGATVQHSPAVKRSKLNVFLKSNSLVGSSDDSSNFSEEDRDDSDEDEGGNLIDNDNFLKKMSSCASLPPLNSNERIPMSQLLYDSGLLVLQNDRKRRQSAKSLDVSLLNPGDGLSKQQSSQKAQASNESNLDSSQKQASSEDDNYEPLTTMRNVALGEEPDCLVIDDQGMILLCIIGTLNSLQVNSIGKISGPEAIECVKHRTRSQLESFQSHSVMIRPFKLIIFDYQMPGMDGPETCRHIKAHYEEVMTPNDSDSPTMAAIRSKIFMPYLVCCSAYEASAIQDKVYEAGMLKILPKPPQLHEFKAILSVMEQELEIPFKQYCKHFEGRVQPVTV